MSYSEKTSQFIFRCFPEFNSLNCFANTGFLFIKITSQTSRRINSLKIKDNTEFSVKQNHAWNHNEKLGARGCVSYFISFKTFCKPLSLQAAFLTDLHGFFGCFFPPSLALEPSQVFHAHISRSGGALPALEQRSWGRGQAVPRVGSNVAPRSHPWLMPGGALCSGGAHSASVCSALWVKPRLAEEGRRSGSELRVNI